MTLKINNKGDIDSLENSKYFNSTNTNLKKELENVLVKTTKNANKKVTSLNKKINTLNKKIAEQHFHFLSLSGIFVSIFTFISVEIQILRYVCDSWRIIGFTLIFLGAIYLFTSLIGQIANPEKKVSYRAINILIVSGIIVSALNSIPYLKQECIISNEEIDKIQNITLLEDKISEQNNELKTVKKELQTVKTELDKQSTTNKRMSLEIIDLNGKFEKLEIEKTSN